MIFRKFLHPLFLIPFLLFLVNRYGLRPTNQVFLDHYLNDLLCMPVVLHSACILMGYIYGLPDYRLGFRQILAATIYLGLVFEWVLPSFSSAYTGDWLDVGMYCCGSGVYYGLLRTGWFA